MFSFPGSTAILDAELVYTDFSQRVQTNGVYFSVQKKVEFVCKYSLELQTIDANFQIAGKDMEFNREARGELHYELITMPSTVIGDWHYFHIHPATWYVVYSRYVDIYFN